MACRYVVTFSPLMDTKEDPQAIIIWDILTGQKKRGFHCESSAHWPIFKSVHYYHCLISLSSLFPYFYNSQILPLFLQVCTLRTQQFAQFTLAPVVKCCNNGMCVFSDGAMMGSSLPG